jgi:Mn2+/Fe2+ NRAMP family transporter
MGEDATMSEAKPERTSGVSLDIVKVSLSRVLLFSFVLSSFSHFFSICFLFLPSLPPRMMMKMMQKMKLTILFTIIPLYHSS